jgi:hypothetical protein
MLLSSIAVYSGGQWEYFALLCGSVGVIDKHSLTDV